MLLPSAFSFNSKKRDPDRNLVIELHTADEIGGKGCICLIADFLKLYSPNIFIQNKYKLHLLFKKDIAFVQIVGIQYFRNSSQ